jgi:hypothetical protein
MLELALSVIIEQASVPRPVRQHVLVCADGRRVVLDNAWPELRIAIEADGLRWHATAAQVAAGRARSRSIQNSGWLHHAYGWSDCHESPLVTRREIEQTLRLRLAA